MIEVAILGYGKVSQSLAYALWNTEGVRLKQIYNRSKITTSDLPLDLFVHDIEELQTADVFIISVPDQFISDLAGQIPFRDSLVVHTAGSLTVDALGNLQNRGVFYPLQTFSKEKRVNFKDLPVFIEAENQESLHLLNRLAQLVHAKVIEASSSQRKALHIAAVFACNFTNHMYRLAYDLCQENQLPFEVLLPLIKETAAKIEHLTPKMAQTGPAQRGDQPTIASHLEFLDSSKYKEIYQILTQSIQNER